MNRALWKLPVSATAIVRGPFFRVHPHRRCEISFSIEGEAGGEEAIGLLFDGVETFKCTYLASLGCIEHRLFREAYATLISLEESAWLAAIKKARSEYYSKTSASQKEPQHLMICFDDGPCYEIICESFQAITRASAID